MKKSLLILILFQVSAFGQTDFNNFLNDISTVDINSRQAVADSFYNYAITKGIPFVENNEAVFIYKGSANSVAVAGDFNGWDYSNDQTLKISGTNFFYLKKEFESNARLDYKLVINGSSWILDPANPNRVSGGYGPNSELAMPDYIQPWEIKYNGSITHGSLTTATLFSANVNKSFPITIYLPPTYYVDSTKNFKTVYFQDGSEYISLGSAVNVIDNLVDSNKIEQVIAVFVKPNNRNDEYAFSLREQYVKFFAEELVPYIDENYRTIKEANSRLVIGDSYGGNISALIAFRHPELFGNCGLHSGAFQPNNYEVYNLWVNSDKIDVNFYSVWGTYEGLDNPMTNFKDIMLNKGYTFGWSKFPEGHSWGLWRATLDLILKDIFPKSITLSTEFGSINKIFYLYQNYPNPFNPSTTIKYQIPDQVLNDKLFVTLSEAEESIVTLKIYDILGREVATLVNKKQNPGNYEVEWNADYFPSGIYFYQLTVGDPSTNFGQVFVETKKMLLIK